MKSTVWIKLDVDCPDPGQAFDVVDDVLDAGTIQDAITEYAYDHDVEIEIESAMSLDDEDVRKVQRKRR